VTAARQPGLDVVRASAMLLGVAFHAAWAYVPDIAPWYLVADASSHEAFARFTSVVHAFRMEVFFTLAGYFSHLLLERRGVDGFLRDRAKRLIVPFVVAAPAIIAADWAMRGWLQARGQVSPFGTGVRWMPGHLWFLEVLFLLCVVAWAAARVGWRGAWLARALRVALRVPESIVVLGVVTGVGVVLHPELRPDASFVPDPATLLHHGLFYAFGFVLWAARDAVGVLERRGWWLGLAGLALAAWVFSGHAQYEDVGRFVSGFIPWLMTLGALSLAFRLKQLASPALTFLVDSAYWVYLVHAPLVQAMQVLLSRESGSPFAKWALVVAVALAGAMLTFRLFVQRTALGPWVGVRR
jgi:glucans biosynthesis protein C